MGFPSSGSLALLLTGLITKIFTRWPLRRDRRPSGEAEAATPDRQKEEEDDDHAGETSCVVQLAGEETPPLPTAAGTSGQDHHQIQNGFWAGIILWRLLGVGARIAAAISALKIRIREVMLWMHEVITEQSEDQGQDVLKRLYKYIMKSIFFVSVLIATLCNCPSYYVSNPVFKVSLAMLLLAFFTDLHTALLLVISSTSFPINCLIYISNITQILILFALLVSYNQLQPYMILIAPLPFFSIPLFHRGRSLEAMDSGMLDHIFDMSAGAYALSAGCAVIAPNIVSEESVATIPLACSLFLTAFLARYLMLIFTVRPLMLVKHAETLMFILKMLLSSAMIFIAVEFLGWRHALAAIILAYAMYVVLFFIYSLACRPRTTHSDNPSNQRKYQQVLSAVMVAIMFMALTQSHLSDHAAAQEASLGSTALLALLYFGGFLWSLNRMLIITLGDVATPPPEGGYAWARVWAALEWVRASIVMVAALDMVYKFVIAVVAASN